MQKLLRAWGDAADGCHRAGSRLESDCYRFDERPVGTKSRATWRSATPSSAWTPHSRESDWLTHSSPLPRLEYIRTHTR